MKLPNKIIRYEESILAKLPIVLTILEKKDKAILELYIEVKDIVANIAEFTEILCCLYALNKIDYNDVTGGIRYVDGNLE